MKAFNVDSTNFDDIPMRKKNKSWCYNRKKNQ